jgi:short chain dehydrogenase
MEGIVAEGNLKSRDTELRVGILAAENAEIGEAPWRGLRPPVAQRLFSHIAVCTTTSQEQAKRPRVRLGANGLNMSTKDPRKLYPQPPYPGKKQTPPGNEEEMSPKVDHGESSYEGTGLLEGRHALITGADSGIGRAVALAFAREGADVAISYLSEEKDARETERLVTEAGCQAILLPGDIGEPSECKAVAQKAIDALGNVDILVNNAAFQRTTKNSRIFLMMNLRKRIA